MAAIMLTSRVPRYVALDVPRSTGAGELERTCVGAAAGEVRAAVRWRMAAFSGSTTVGGAVVGSVPRGGGGCAAWGEGVGAGVGWLAGMIDARWWGLWGSWGVGGTCLQVVWIGHACLVVRRASLVVRHACLVVGRACLVVRLACVVIGRACLVIRRACVVIGRACVVVGLACLVIRLAGLVARPPLERGTRAGARAGGAGGGHPFEGV